MTFSNHALAIQAYYAIRPDWNEGEELIREVTLDLPDGETATLRVRIGADGTFSVKFSAPEPLPRKRHVVIRDVEMS